MLGDGIRKQDEIISATSSMMAGPIAMDRHLIGPVATSSVLLSYTACGVCGRAGKSYLRQFVRYRSGARCFRDSGRDVSIQMTGPSDRSFIHN